MQIKDGLIVYFLCDTYQRYNGNENRFIFDIFISVGDKRNVLMCIRVAAMKRERKGLSAWTHQTNWCCRSWFCFYFISPAHQGVVWHSRAITLMMATIAIATPQTNKHTQKDGGEREKVAADSITVRQKKRTEIQNRDSLQCTQTLKKIIVADDDAISNSFV